MPGPDGTVMHAEVSIGKFAVDARRADADRAVLDDEFPSTCMSMTSTRCTSARTGAGAKSVSPPADQFWGDRMATVTDSFGNTWSPRDA